MQGNRMADDQFRSPGNPFVTQNKNNNKRTMNEYILVASLTPNVTRKNSNLSIHRELYTCLCFQKICTFLINLSLSGKLLAVPTLILFQNPAAAVSTHSQIMLHTRLVMESSSEFFTQCSTLMQSRNDERAATELNVKRWGFTRRTSRSIMLLTADEVSRCWTHARTSEFINGSALDFNYISWISFIICWNSA